MQPIGKYILVKQLKEQVHFDGLQDRIDELKQNLDEQQRHWRSLLSEIKRYA